MGQFAFGSRLRGSRGSRGKRCEFRAQVLDSDGDEFPTHIQTISLLYTQVTLLVSLLGALAPARGVLAFGPWSTMYSDDIGVPYMWCCLFRIEF